MNGTFLFFRFCRLPIGLQYRRFAERWPRTLFGILLGIVVFSSSEAKAADPSCENALTLLRSGAEERRRGAEEILQLTCPAELRDEARRVVRRTLQVYGEQDETLVANLVKALSRWNVNTTSILVRAILAGEESKSRSLAKAIHGIEGWGSREQTEEIAGLSDSTRSKGIRLIALEVLGILRSKDPATLLALRQAMKDEDPEIRLQSLLTMRRSGDKSPETIQSLRGMTNDAAAHVASQAQDTLTSLGVPVSPVPVPVQVPVPKSDARAALKFESPPESPTPKKPAPEAVVSQIPSLVPKGEQTPSGKEEIKSPDVVLQILAGLASSDPRLRAESAMKVSELKQFDDRLFPLLSEALRDSDSRVRFSAGYALQFTDGRGVETLKSALKHEDLLVRLNAAQALQPMVKRDERVLGILEKTLETESDSAVRIQGALGILTLVPTHRAALEALINELPTAGITLRPRMLNALKAVDGTHLVSLFRGAAREGNVDLRREIALTLPEVAPHSRSARKLLIALVDDENEEVREAAIAVLRRQSTENESE